MANPPTQVCQSATSTIPTLVESTTESVPKTSCVLSLFGQVAKTSIPEDALREVEAENQKPTGASVARAPGMHIDGVLISKGCGLAIEFKADGIR
jgi:transmembrane E3 ubiquitin-protein ligase